MAAKKDKVTIVVPNEAEFGPAEIPFGVVTGDGVPDYDNQKSNGRRGGMNYAVTLILSKKENKFFRKQIMEFWEDNKPKHGEDEPANFAKMTRKDKDNKKQVLLFAKTQTKFETEDGEIIKNKVGIINHKGDKLDPETHGNIGKGSKGRLALTLAVYGDDEDAGVSVYLSGVKLTDFVAFEASGGTAAFGEEEGNVSADHDFSKEKDHGKSKKKKKSKK